MKTIRQIVGVGDIVKINRKGDFPMLKPRFYEKRLKDIFSGISFEYSHPSDIDLFEHDMRVIVSGHYDRLRMCAFSKVAFLK